MFQSRIWLFAAYAYFGISFFAASITNADVVISSGTSANPATSYTEGFMNGLDFVANSDLSLTDLGLWDSASDGLASSYQVGIWKTPTASVPTPILLASVFIDDTDQLDTNVVVNSGSWRYETLATPISLTKDSTYTLGWQTGADPLSIADSLYLSPYSGGNGITILNLERTSFNQHFSLSFPFRTFPNTFALRGMANAKFVTSVPEPSFCLTFAWLGGLLLFRRIRKK